MINFPTSIDTLTNPIDTDTLNSPNHADQHSDLNDAVEALESKVGVDSSAVETSHDYKLSHLTAGDITDITASVEELNILDGVTSTAAELNLLDGVNVCTVRLASDQSIANTTPVAISWDTDISDAGDWHDPSTNPSRITVPTAGNYLITASVQYAANATGNRGVEIYVNGSSTYGRSFGPSCATNTYGGAVATVLTLAANDYVEIYTYQSSGGALDAKGGTSSTSSYASVTKLAV